jgi:hypothetical protein
MSAAPGSEREELRRKESLAVNERLWTERRWTCSIGGNMEMLRLIASDDEFFCSGD